MQTSPRTVLSCALLLLVGCHADSPDHNAVVIGDAGCSVAEPPLVVLRYLDSETTGEQGSYCTFSPDQDCSRCVDRSIRPLAFTGVLRGDLISIAMLNGDFTPGERCQPACPPTLRIEPVACQPAPQLERELQEDLSWRVDLDPGLYWLWVDSHFNAGSAGTGSTYVGFGLSVSNGLAQSFELAEHGAECDAGLSDPDAG